MNPLSNWTYHSRNKRHAFLILSLCMIVTLGIYSLLALVWGVFMEPGRVAYNAYSKFSLVTVQSTEDSPGTEVLTKLKSNPDIEKIIPSKFIRVELPGMVPGEGFQFDLLGLNKKDADYLKNRLSATLKDGRVPQPGAAEIVLSEDVANILNVKVGDSYIATSSEFYAGMDRPPEPIAFTVVGIFESDIELGIFPLEYLNHQVRFRKFPSRFLIVAQDGRNATVDEFLHSEILPLTTGVMTQQIINERIFDEALPGLLMLLPVVFIVVIAFSLMIVVVNKLVNDQRLPEFGILHAIGRSRNWLGRRLTMETIIPAMIGWVLGILIAWMILYLLKWTFFADRGYDLNYPIWLPCVFSIPIPVGIAVSTFFSVRRILTSLDPVTIIERRELSHEVTPRRPGMASRSSSKPLSSATYYQRHRRQAVLVISAMILMIMSIALFIFALAVGAEAKVPFLGYLKQVSVVRSPGIVESLDPDVVEQVKANTAVDRVIQVAPRYNMLNVYIPPFNTIDASPFGVYAEDMAYMIELYDLALKEGSLPHPGTNEMVISESLAQNRNLRVGDVIGDPDHPAYPNAPQVKTEFIISGIFAQPKPLEVGSGLSFVSLEFLEKSKAFDIPDVLPLIVVSKVGQKDLLDDWLENDLDSEKASVLTYRQEISRIQNQNKQDMLSIALLEVIIILVAAISLAVVYYIFISQRQSEFGVLNALGYSPRQLVMRVVGETIYMVGIGWVTSVIVCLIGMLFLRFVLFAPLGLRFELLDLTPWLYTLPIPVVILAVTTITTARTLSKLDPISIIERRL